MYADHLKYLAALAGNPQERYAVFDNRKVRALPCIIMDALLPWEKSLHVSEHLSAQNSDTRSQMWSNHACKHLANIPLKVFRHVEMPLGVFEGHQYVIS